jgi:hypothetical protein
MGGHEIDEWLRKDGWPRERSVATGHERDGWRAIAVSLSLAAVMESTQHPNQVIVPHKHFFSDNSTLTGQNK